MIHMQPSRAPHAMSTQAGRRSERAATSARTGAANGRNARAGTAFGTSARNRWCRTRAVTVSPWWLLTIRQNEAKECNRIKRLVSLYLYFAPNSGGRLPLRDEIYKGIARRRRRCEQQHCSAKVPAVSCDAPTGRNRAAHLRKAILAKQFPAKTTMESIDRRQPATIVEMEQAPRRPALLPRIRRPTPRPATAVRDQQARHDAFVEIGSVKAATSSPIGPNAATTSQSLGTSYSSSWSGYSTRASSGLRYC